MGALRQAETAIDNHPRAEQCKRASNLSHITAVRLALSAGLRRGEVLGLSWGDVDSVNGLLRVRRSLCCTSGELKTPKTESGIRDVALDACMLSDLMRWKAAQAEYLFTFGIAQGAETPIISSEIGGRMDGHHMGRWWRAFKKRYGFDTLRFHDLRHTHATMLISSGLNPKAVSSRLGHSSVGITLDLYAHAQREDDEKAAAIMGAIMAEQVPPLGQVVNL
jgi:integrase